MRRYSVRYGCHVKPARDTNDVPGRIVLFPQKIGATIRNIIELV
jgi:hypothetical protein